jgi:hypothetical protein
VILGLSIDNDTEVTSRTLRAPRLAQTLDEFLDELATRPQQAPQAERAWRDAAAEYIRVWSEGREPSEAAANLSELATAWRVNSKWRATLAKLPAAEAPDKARGRGARPPTANELQRFAAVYAEERIAKPRGAVTRAAKQYKMHRVTAHRWITLCRDAGYLPAEDDA